MRKPALLKKLLTYAPLVLGSTLFVFSGRLDGAAQGPTKETERLAGILSATCEYCEKVKAMALQFICIEKITDVENFFGGISNSSTIVRDEKIFSVRRIKRRTFSHDYQLLKKGEDFTERRILLERNGRNTHVENVGLDQLKYSCTYPIFGSVGFLSRYWQAHFTYSIVGDEMLDGERAVVIRAVPIEFREENFNTGNIWINEAAQVVRIEWEPESIYNNAAEIITSPRGEFRKTVSWSVDYSVEKNGIRFPGNQVVREIFFQDLPTGLRRQALKREIRFEYKEYKFFVVDTNVDIRDPED
jgi:hypothetical protein